MMKKSKTISAAMACWPHPHARGKALLNIGMALVMWLYGFGQINIQVLALMLGVIFAIKGAILMMESSHC